MLTRREANAGLIGAAMLAAAPSAIAAETERALPPPRLDGGKPLMQALRARRSTREFAGRALPAEVLSDLLWAAYGTNRPSGDRTAPYWRHMMVIDVYAAMADDYAGLEMVKEWREQVWRNAERLLAAKTAQDRAQVADQIQQYAAGWARMIANPIQVPGYRAQRDAYCQAALQSQP